MINQGVSHSPRNPNSDAAVLRANVDVKLANVAGTQHTNCMILRLLFLKMFAFLVGSAQAASTENVSLLPRCDQTVYDLCGYIDAKTWRDYGREEFVIEAKFERARKFFDGLAAVQLGGKVGYIDPSGDIVIPPQYVRAGDFAHGLAPVKIGGALGIIDRKGKLVLEPQFAEVWVFDSQIVLASPAREDEQVSLGPSLNSISSAGIFHLNRGWITEPDYTFKRFGQVVGDLVWAAEAVGKRGTFDDLIGLMRIDGSWLIEPIFTYASAVKDDWAMVRKRINGKTISGALDGRGNEAVPFEFDYLTHWNEEYLLAGKGPFATRKYGIVNGKGVLLAGRYFDKILRAERFHGPNHPTQKFFTVNDGGDWKSLFPDGTLKPDQRIGQIYFECEQFTVRYALNGYDLIPNDPSLPTVWSEKLSFYSSNRVCSPTPKLIRNGKSAAINNSGSVFGGFFDNGYGFFGPNRWVTLNGKWGLVDVVGNFVVEAKFDRIENEGGFPNVQRMPVKKTSASFKVEIGEEVFRLSYESGAYVQEPFTENRALRALSLKCRGGATRIQEDGLWGLVAENGDYLVPPRYRAIGCYNGGIVFVPDDARGKWCPLDRFGQRRPEEQCSAVTYPTWMTHHSPEQFHDDPYESSVLWYEAWLEYHLGNRDTKPRMIPW